MDILSTEKQFKLVVAGGRKWWREATIALCIQVDALLHNSWQWTVLSYGAITFDANCEGEIMLTFWSFVYNREIYCSKNCLLSLKLGQTPSYFGHKASRLHAPSAAIGSVCQRKGLPKAKHSLVLTMQLKIIPLKWSSRHCLHWIVYFERYTCKLNGFTLS